MPKLKIYKFVALVVSFVYLIYVSTETYNMYRAWNSTELFQALMVSPLDKEAFYPLLGKFVYLFNYKYGYFVYVAFEKFWFDALRVVAVIWLMYILFWIFARRQNRLNKIDETKNLP